MEDIKQNLEYVCDYENISENQNLIEDFISNHFDKN